MRRIALLCSVALFLCVVVTPVVAQVPAPSPRKGMWLGVGLGYGAVKLSCEICREEGGRVGGPSGYLRVGATATSSLLLGAEVEIWRGKGNVVDDDDETPPATRTSANLFAVAYWYPSPAHGFYLKGGLGLVAWRAGGDQATTNSLGGVLGLGYEIPIDKQWSIAPFFNYMDSSKGTLKYNGSPLSVGASTSMYQVGLGVTYH